VVTWLMCLGGVLTCAGTGALLIFESEKTRLEGMTGYADVHARSTCFDRFVLLSSCFL
jgi:hypothetical protein